MALFRRQPEEPLAIQRRRGYMGMRPVRAGLIALVVIVVGSYLGFSKHIPFTHGYRLKAVFPSANSIRINSPVRIAGVNVGKVKDVERYKGSTDALVTLELSDSALPIHRDATLAIRPRIFLEGNFFVDLRPGTPSAPTVPDNGTIPVTQTSDPVQLDQVLTALQSDTRSDLQDLLAGYGGALTQTPTPAQNSTLDPEVRGLSGAQALNKSLEHSPGAFLYGSQVNDALTGSQPHDLSRLVAGLARTSGALDRNEAALQGFVVNFNRTVAATAAESVALQQSIQLLGPTLTVARSALAHLDSSLPATRAFAREILPGVRETPATIAAAFPWIDQARGLLGPNELRGVAHELSPATASLAALTDRTLKLLPQLDLFNRCVSKVILPAGDIVVQDPPLTTGKANYKEFWYGMTGLAGEGQNFDGNGMYVRFAVGGGSQTISTGASSLSGDRLFGNVPTKPLGNRPAYPGRRPPYNPTFPCYRNPLPAVNDAATTPVSSSAAAPASAAPRGGSLLPALGEVLGRLNPLRGVKLR